MLFVDFTYLQQFQDQFVIHCYTIYGLSFDEHLFQDHQTISHRLFKQDLSTRRFISRSHKYTISHSFQPFPDHEGLNFFLNTTPCDITVCLMVLTITSLSPLDCGNLGVEWRISDCIIQIPAIWLM